MSEDFDKYLAIANHDIQVANNIGELKSYVASILWENDKKVELLQQKENIIKEVREKIKDHLYAKTILSDMYSDNEIFEFILEKIGDIDE